jgi:hypothetical protein
MHPTQSGREHAGAVEVTRHEEDTVEAEWAEEAEEFEVAKEGVDPRTTPREVRSWSPSLSRYRAQGRSWSRARTGGVAAATSPELGRCDGSIDPADAENHSLASAEQEQQPQGTAPQRTRGLLEEG